MRNTKERTRVSLLLALTLAACGGGGGGGDAATPGASSADTTTGTAPAADPSAGGAPVAAPAPGSGGAATGAQFAAFGPVTVAPSVTFEGGNAGAEGPKVARLAGGGAVIAWKQAGALVAQQVDAAGNLVGAQQSVASQATIFSVAGLPGGEWVVAWSAATVPPDAVRSFTVTVQTRRYGADGTLLQDTTLVNPEPVQSIDAGLDVAATADSGYVVAWSARSSLAGPRQVLMQRFSAGGAAAGGPATATAPTAADQTQPRVVPLADGTVVLAWLQDAGGGATGAPSFAIHTRPFSSASAPLEAERQVAASVGSAAFPFAAAPVDDDHIGLVWAQPSSVTNTEPIQARWQILDAEGDLESPVGGITVGPLIDSVAIAPAGRGFTAFVQVVNGNPRGTAANIGSIAVDNDGAAAATALAPVVDRSLNSVAPLTGTTTGPAGPAFSVSGGSDGRYVLAYESATATGAEVDALGK